MFFDCTALLAGLVAALVSRWAANDRFSYGYVRAEVIAGFVNALFLLFIAFFIFAEAIEVRLCTITKGTPVILAHLLYRGITSTYNYNNYYAQTVIRAPLSNWHN